MLVVEEHPHVRPLGGRRPFERLLLDEIRHGGDLCVHGFVQLSVEGEWRHQPHGANRRAVQRIPSDHLWLDGRRWSVDRLWQRSGETCPCRHGEGRGRRPQSTLRRPSRFRGDWGRGCGLWPADRAGVIRRRSPRQVTASSQLSAQCVDHLVL